MCHFIIFDVTVAYWYAMLPLRLLGEFPKYKFHLQLDLAVHIAIAK